MNEKNLKQLGNIIKSIIITMQSSESDGVVFCPKSTMDGWQRDLFSILCDERKGGERKRFERKDFVIDKGNLYLLPSINMVNKETSFSIVFNWLMFHARIRWVKEK